MSREGYFAARHAEKSKDPAYRKMLADRSAAYRVRHPHKTSESNAKRRAADPEKSRRESREWFARNPEKRVLYEQNRRAKKRAKGGRLSLGIRQKLLVLQRGRCACCRADLSSVVVHLDHIMPLALGGLHVDGNMQLLCQPCNQAKYSKHPVDFMRQRGFLL